MRRLYRALPAVLVLAALGIAPVVAHESDALDCSACHVCDNPTATDPCLKAETCPRHELSQSLAADLGPEIVILDQLEDLYVAVRFDHHAHAAMVDMGEGCETCHHFSPPNSPHPSCRECHPANIQHEDLTQPGLKGAYHRQCMGCHSDWDHDTKCEVCHAKKAGGRLHGTATTFTHDRHYEPIEMKELIIFETGYEDGDTVPVHHRNHAELYEVNCFATSSRAAPSATCMAPSRIRWASSRRSTSTTPVTSATWTRTAATATAAAPGISSITPAPAGR